MYKQWSAFLHTTDASAKETERTPAVGWEANLSQQHSTRRPPKKCCAAWPGQALLRPCPGVSCYRERMLWQTVAPVRVEAVQSMTTRTRRGWVCYGVSEKENGKACESLHYMWQFWCSAESCPLGIDWREIFIMAREIYHNHFHPHKLSLKPGKLKLKC